MDQLNTSDLTEDDLASTSDQCSPWHGPLCKDRFAIPSSDLEELDPETDASDAQSPTCSATTNDSESRNSTINWSSSVTSKTTPRNRTLSSELDEDSDCDLECFPITYSSSEEDGGGK